MPLAALNVNSSLPRIGQPNDDHDGGSNCRGSACHPIKELREPCSTGTLLSNGGDSSIDGGTTLSPVGLHHHPGEHVSESELAALNSGVFYAVEECADDSFVVDFEVAFSGRTPEGLTELERERVSLTAHLRER